MSRRWLWGALPESRLTSVGVPQFPRRSVTRFSDFNRSGLVDGDHLFYAPESSMYYRLRSTAPVLRASR